MTNNTEQRRAAITQDELKAVLRYDPESGEFFWLHSTRNTKIGAKAGCISHGYIAIRISRVLYLAHRLAWIYVYGENPELQVDHINLNRADNRIVNLRLATHSDNKRNEGVRKNNRSGFKGVGWDVRSNKWQARCYVNGKTHHLGFFTDPAKAAEAYKEFASKEHGQFFRSAA
jgi:hypothetical protein